MNTTRAARQALVQPDRPNLLTYVVADNVHRLRTAHGWNQTQLSKLLRADGLVDWSPSTVTLVEQGKRRCDHLLELTALCRIFGVGLAELLAGPPEASIATSGEPVPYGSVALAFAGQVAAADIAALPDTDDPYDLAPVAKTLGITTDQLFVLVWDVFGTYGFGEVRDRKAGLKSEHRHSNTEPNTRGRRGHATRAMLAQMRERLERDTWEEIQHRFDAAVVSRKERQRMADRAGIAEYLAVAFAGRWPTESEIDAEMRDQGMQP